MLSPITVFFKSPELGSVPNLDFEKEQVGLEVVQDLGSKTVLDAFTCVECGRCQVNCPAWGAGKELNPKTLILQTQQALLAGPRDAKLGEIYTERVLWQCTTCGACENQCPVGIEHLPLIIGARRGLVSNGDAPEYLGGVYNHLERRGNIWAELRPAGEVCQRAGARHFDPTTHDVSCGSDALGFEADFQRSLRSLFEISQLARRLASRERALQGDPAKRTVRGHIQELATGILRTSRARSEKILHPCPHCVKNLGDDYGGWAIRSNRAFGGVVEESRGTSRLGIEESR